MHVSWQRLAPPPVAALQQKQTQPRMRVPHEPNERRCTCTLLHHAPSSLMGERQMGQSWRPDARHSRMQVGQKWCPQLVIVRTDSSSRLHTREQAGSRGAKHVAERARACSAHGLAQPAAGAEGWGCRRACSTRHAPDGAAAEVLLLLVRVSSVLGPLCSINSNSG